MTIAEDRNDDRQQGGLRCRRDAFPPVSGSAPLSTGRISIKMSASLAGLNPHWRPDVATAPPGVGDRPREGGGGGEDEEGRRK